MNAKRHRFTAFPRTFLLHVLIAASGLAAARAQFPVQNAAALSIQAPSDFYDALTPYGSWVNVSPYGRCWRPVDVDRDWRPYTQGYWEWTDAGWYWVSDEPWAWACYHYGQWLFDPAYGWVWLPGTEWAPAWVVWREAPDYIGWAPCGPGGALLTSTSFVFVDAHHFRDRLGPRELVLNDPGILRRSRPVGQFRTESRDFGGTTRRIAFNPGPGVDPIQKATGKRFTARPVHELIQQPAMAPSTARQTGARERRPEQSGPSRQEPQTPTGPERGRFYREPPPVQAPATGRSEQRIYHEVPKPQPTPMPPPQSRRTPAEMPTPPAVAPRERPLPSPGLERRGLESQPARPEQRVSPPPETAPRVTPPPPQPVIPPAAQPPAVRRENRERERDGQ